MLAEGISSSVYAVRDYGGMCGGRDLSLKEVMAKHSTSPDFKAVTRQMLFDAEILLAANHPGVISLQHLLQRHTPTGEVIVGMVMQRVVGSARDLVRAICGPNTMSELCACVYAWGIGEASKYCHEELGVAIRDLNACNVLIRPEDGWPMVSGGNGTAIS